MTEQLKDPPCTFDVEAFISIDKEQISLFSSDQIIINKNSTFTLKNCLINNNAMNNIIEDFNLQKKYTIEYLKIFPLFTVIFDYISLDKNSIDILNNEFPNPIKKEVNNQFLNYRHPCQLEECSINNLSLSMMPGRRVIAANLEAVFKSISIVKT